MLYWEMEWFSGLGLGPLLEVVLIIEPAIIPTAFLATCLVFACFTLASMLTNQRQYIYLGGKQFHLVYFKFLISKNV